MADNGVDVRLFAASRPWTTVTSARGNPEEVLDAVFDFAEHLIAQQRAFAKQMLAAATKGQQATDAPASSPSTEDSASADPTGPGHSTTPGAG